uniref:Uncharacterized protein n=1 Tax=Ciona intestinalis TaxID=7719 RepID=H2XSX3_CIOIN
MLTGSVNGTSMGNARFDPIAASSRKLSCCSSFSVASPVLSVASSPLSQRTRSTLPMYLFTYSLWLGTSVHTAQNTRRHFFVGQKRWPM